MLERRTAFISAAACASLFIAVMAWDVVVQHPRLGGNQVCIKDAGSAELFEAEGPGAYTFDLNTGRAVRMPASIALAMSLRGIFSPNYPGQSRCGVKALTQTVDGLVASGALVGTVAFLLIGAFTRARRGTGKPLSAAS